ncbi:MAG: hypothetical protein MZV70_17780 [Desulfobacterales bacterium]|nr:hypothetical protein [Desulfobacterales bacterium]
MKRDDAFARQIYCIQTSETESLTKKPEEQLDNEPEWLKRLKSGGNARKPAPAQQKPIEEEILLNLHLNWDNAVEEVVPVEPEPVSQLEIQPLVDEAVPAEPEPVSQLEIQPPVEEAAPIELEPVSQFEQRAPFEEETSCRAWVCLTRLRNN